jgi:hypothetical protein
MRAKNLISVMILFFYFLSFSVAHGQQQKQGNDENQPMGSRSQMQKCIDAIASDSTSRMEMMSRMMEQVRGDSSGMKQMCKKMMQDPEMQKMMMNMMHGEGMGGMMKDDMENSMKDREKGDKMDHDMKQNNRTPQTPLTP